MQFAVTTAPAVFDTRSLMMGRQSAGVGFLRAALTSRPERIWCYAAERQHAQSFADDICRLSSFRPELRYVNWTEPGRLAEAGLLYRADPGISSDAWLRRRYSKSRAYSICGITHSLSTLNSLNAIAGLQSAPLYSWDAVICTSTAARDLYRSVQEEQREHLAARFGATRFPLPQLPMIPLGVHAADFAFSPSFREQARTGMGLGAEDVAVLFAGRLSFHGKAHPLPMFLALEEVVKSTQVKVHLILFGQFPSDAVKDAYLAEAAHFAPSVRISHLDGASNENRDRAWAGADIFTSLSENVQETFGLTPVEAMAAGLPVVVSDWNGYKDTVRNGVDGFRVVTIQAPSGAGCDLIERYDLNIDHYDTFIGSVSQFTAVDVTSAVEAYRQLILSHDLRKRMGDAGRRRVQQQFDWSLIFRRYTALWEELAERRRSDPHHADEDARTTRPERPDPYSLFRTFPTSSFSSSTIVFLRAGVTREEALNRLKMLSISYARAVLPNEGVVGMIFDTLRSGNVFPITEIAERIGRPLDNSIYRAAAWMTKMGIISVM